MSPRASLPRLRRKPARRLRGIARTEAILAAAREVLAREGYAEFTLRKIAGRVKIRLSTLQHYYPTKEDLFRAVVEETTAAYDAAYGARESGLGGSPRARLLARIDYLLEDIRKPETAGFFYELWARAFRDPYAAELMQRAYRHHRDRLRTAMAPLNPRLSGRLAEQRAVLVAALIEGMMLFIGAHKPGEPALEGIEAEVRRFVLRLATQR